MSISIYNTLVIGIQFKIAGEDLRLEKHENEIFSLMEESENKIFGKILYDKRQPDDFTIFEGFNLISEKERKQILKRFNEIFSDLNVKNPQIKLYYVQQTLI
jgi:hypothetical protein